MTYLTHLTLNTGHVRRSWLSEVDPAAIDHTRDLLTDAIANGGVQMPVPGYWLDAEPFGSRRAMMATVRNDGAPLMVMGVAARAAGALWERLTQTQQAARTSQRVHEQPPAPWCAALLLPALAGDPATKWLGDFERCAAWAWMQ